jgi:hypothetical protein
MSCRALVGVGVALVSCASLGSSAWGAPTAAALTVRHGRTIHVTIGGRTEEAFALRGVPGGWKLELAGTSGGAPSGSAPSGVLVVRDVTVGATGPRTFELPLAPGAIVLDDGRFRADHAYKVELRRGTVVVGGALIYLQPLKQRGPVVFDDREAVAPAAPPSDELQTSDKGSL